MFDPTPTVVEAVEVAGRIFPVAIIVPMHENFSMLSRMWTNHPDAMLAEVEAGIPPIQVSLN